MNIDNDQELAHEAYRLLGHGTARKCWAGHHSWPVYQWGLDQYAYVRDWRVAGRLMTMLRARGYSFLLTTFPDGQAIMTVQSPYPDRKDWAAQVVANDDCRAIVAASVKALRDAESEHCLASGAPHAPGE